MATSTEHPPRWMSLGEVCRALEINEATLRQWADRGRLPVYRTPGGHRRFLREDVDALLSRNEPTGTDPEDLALQRIRRKLSQSDFSGQPWMASFHAEGRDRMRLFGRRLLSLLLRNDLEGQSRRRGETMSETHMLGHEYGSEMAVRGVPLTDSVQAFLFFRQAVVESVQPDRLRQVVEIADGVLVGLVDAYSIRLAATENDAYDNRQR